MAVWYGSPTGRVEKAGPFFLSQAGGQGCLGALELWGVQGIGHCAQPASAWEPALGVNPYPVLAPAPLSFFLIRYFFLKESAMYVFFHICIIRQTAKGIFRDVYRVIEAKMAKTGGSNLLNC